MTLSLLHKRLYSSPKERTPASTKMGCVSRSAFGSTRYVSLFAPPLLPHSISISSYSLSSFLVFWKAMASIATTVTIPSISSSLLTFIHSLYWSSIYKHLSPITIHWYSPDRRSWMLVPTYPPTSDVPPSRSPRRTSRSRRRRTHRRSTSRPRLPRPRRPTAPYGGALRRTWDP